MAKAEAQAAWRLLPRFLETVTIGATTTEVDLSDYVGMFVAFRAEADMHINATYGGSTATAATAKHFPLSADVVLEFKVKSGDLLTAIGAGDLDLFQTG